MIFKEWRESLNLAVAAIGAGREEYRLLIDKRMAKVEKCLPMKIDADFIWKIDRLAERVAGTPVDSEYFNIRAERYKMRLCCEWRYNKSTEVGIYLRIYSDKNDEGLQWPFQRRVTIMINNHQCQHVYRAITNQCRIEKPPNNEYRSSDSFTFQHSDLTNAGVLLGNNMIVNCSVHLK